MAKSKKDIDAFQKAMLTNTKVIGKRSKSTTSSDTTAKTSSKTRTSNSAPQKAIKTTSKATSQGLAIDPVLYKEFEKVSSKYNINADKFIDVSLRMILELEDYWFTENE